MKFVYFALNGEGSFKGVNEKILHQVSELNSLGVDATLALVCDDSFKTQFPFVTSYKIANLNESIRWNLFARIARQFNIIIVLRKIVTSLDQGSILYLRYPIPLFCGILNIPNKLKKYKIVAEYNSIENKEYRLSKNYVRLLWGALFGLNSQEQVDGIVGVTEEITRYQLKNSGDPKKPNVTIGNGISVASLKPSIRPIFSGENLNILFVANINRWHGIDRLLRGLAAYRGDLKVILYIVGDGPELRNLKTIVNELELEDNVVFTGVQTEEALDYLFDKCHIAVGSLAIHRKGLNQTSELKMREYSARGIPFLSSALDPDFPEEFPYILKAPADESPIDIEEAVRFAKRVYSDPEHSQKLRAYAKAKLDWSIKAKILKDFCESLTKSAVY